MVVNVVVRLSTPRYSTIRQFRRCSVDCGKCSHHFRILSLNAGVYPLPTDLETTKLADFELEFSDAVYSMNN